jgi:hypothetical protein
MEHMFAAQIPALIRAFGSLPYGAFGLLLVLASWTASGNLIALTADDVFFGGLSFADV